MRKKKPKKTKSKYNYKARKGIVNKEELESLIDSICIF